MSSDKTGTQRNWIASKIDEHIITLQNQFTKKFLDADSNGEIDVSDTPQLDDQWIMVKTETNRNDVEGNSILLKIYPNPVVDKLNISYQENFNPVLIKIYDLQGKKINEIKTLENSNFNEEIDVTNLIDGLYVIEVFFEDYNSIKKQFIIRN